jgi:hypothetical protein
VWEKKAGGYVYVNEEKDVMFFGGPSSGFLIAYNHRELGDIAVWRG